MTATPDLRQRLHHHPGQLDELEDGSQVARYTPEGSRRVFTKADGLWTAPDSSQVTTEALVASYPLPALDRLLALHVGGAWEVYRATPYAPGRWWLEAAPWNGRRWFSDAYGAKRMERQEDGVLVWFTVEDALGIDPRPVEDGLAWATPVDELQPFAVQIAMDLVARVVLELPTGATWGDAQRQAPQDLAEAMAVIGWEPTLAAFRAAKLERVSP